MPILFFPHSAGTGATPATSSSSAYVRGYKLLSDTKPSFIRGYLSLTNDKSLYIEGVSSFVVDSKSSYIHGHINVTTNRDAFTRGASSLTGANNLFIYGSTAITSIKASYIRGLSTSTSTCNTYVAGTFPPIASSHSIYMRGIGTRDVCSHFHDCYITSQNDRILSHTRCYITSSNQVRISSKRSHIVSTGSSSNPYKLSSSTRAMIAPNSVRAGKGAYISGGIASTTTWDSRFETDPTIIVTFDSLFLYDTGSRTLHRAHITYPIDKVIDLYIDLPTEAAPGIISSVQQVYLRRYREKTSSHACHISGVLGVQRSFKVCWISKVSDYLTDSQNCYINGGAFVRTSQSVFMMGGYTQFKRIKQLCYINTPINTATGFTRAYGRGHIGITSAKKCYIPTIQISKGRTQAYIAGV